MILLISTPLLLSLATASSGPAGDPTAAEANVIEVYDLSSVLPGTMRTGTRETLLPYLSPGFHGDGDDWDAMTGADTVIDLLRALCGDEFDYEGREILLDADDGRLIVRAPPAIQAKTQTYLRFLEAVLGASLELRIDAVDLAESESTSAVPVLLPMAEVDRILAQAERGGIRTYRLHLRAGDAAALDLTRAAALVVDYDVEVAQASAIADPIVEQIPVGARLQARAAPAAGGTWLSLLLRRGEPLSGVIDRDLQVAGHVLTQDRVVSHPVSSVYQTVEVLNRSFAIDTFLPEGRALAIHSTVATGSRTRTEVILVRRASGSLPTVRRIALDPKSPRNRGEVVFLNAESASPPHGEIEARALPRTGLPARWNMTRTSDSGREVGVTSGFSSGSVDLLRDLLGAGAQDLEIRDVGPCLFLSTVDGGSDAAGLEALFPREGGTGFGLLERFSPPARLVQVTLVLRRGGGAPLARCTLPVRLGRSAAAVLGSERIEVADWDVEVAQGVSVADAVMRTAFDGLAIEVRPSLSLAGDLTLSLLARAHVRRGERRELDLGVRGLGPLDQATHDQAFLRERLVFGEGDGKARRFLLGDSSESAAAGGLCLEVEAVELK